MGALTKKTELSQDIFEDFFFAPTTINNDSQNKRALDILNTLIEAQESIKNKKEKDILSFHINSLASRISEYENKTYNIGNDVSGRDALEFLIEQNDINKSELSDCLGSISHINLILAGKREIGIKAAKKLAQKFSVAPSLFLGIE